MSRKVRFLRGPKEKERLASRPVVNTGEDSKVQQQFRNDCDPNTIVRRFGVTGQLGQVDLSGAAMYGDFTGINDLESALDRMERVNQTFMALPPEVRERFGNDVVAFAGEAMASDPASFELKVRGDGGVLPGVGAPAETAASGAGAGVSGGAAAS